MASALPPDQPPSPSPGPPPGSRQVAKGAGTALLARAGGVIEILSQPLYVWLFGLPTYGLYMVLWSAVNLIENIFDLGMTSALQRVIPQASDDRERATALRQAMLMGVCPCLLIALAASLGAQWIAQLVNVGRGIHGCNCLVKIKCNISESVGDNDYRQHY